MNKYKTLLSPPTILGESSLIGSVNVDQIGIDDRKLHEQRRRARAVAKQQQVSERLMAATQELTAGVSESQAAIHELQQALEQMASGAEQASAACEESSLAISKILENVNAVSDTASLSMNRSLVVQQMITGSASDINQLVDGVAVSAEKSSASARLIMELENQAKEISDIIVTVVNLADQTNLLALNAAIEAARAGEHGNGFAVVADEVRTLAETAEKAAMEIRQVVEQVQTEVNIIAESIKETEQISMQEMKNGQEINASLLEMNQKMQVFVDGSKEIHYRLNMLRSSVQDFEDGSRKIAETAEEQAAGANQALRAIVEQNKVLIQIKQSSVELSDMAEDLRSARDVGKSAELLASASDELSASIIEGGQSATEIMTAINQIDNSAQLQSAATEQSSSAVMKLDTTVNAVTGLAEEVEQNVKEVSELHEHSKAQTELLIQNISHTLDMLASNMQRLFDLETRVRQIERIVNLIDRVGIQTNMLAVNGAIEAAGAGQYGRGFAVVAGDIRNLAQETAMNADHIKELLRDIQSQVMLVVRDIISARDTTRTEVEKARRVIAELTKLDQEFSTLVVGIVSNNENLLEVQQAIGESKKAIEQIASAASEAAAATKQASLAGQEQNVGLNELSRAIEDIAIMADELHL
ncbi:methyl-accepting chemotaxis protein [Paenibacillus septentrionalis]|uniref:Methyl-accepting chemotaxis protein n=1 Tax=Paenibacillus septentrionalis TaxID=429342 RepID=A0ABW1V6E3_9BACL